MVDLIDDYWKLLLMTTIIAIIIILILIGVFCLFHCFHSIVSPNDDKGVAPDNIYESGINTC